jgi:hypothetical protein
MPYTTYIDKHWAPMLVDPLVTAQRAHTLKRHCMYPYSGDVLEKRTEREAFFK